MTNERLKLLTYFIMAYVLLAFFWWALLLFMKNREAASARQDAHQFELLHQGVIQSAAEFEQTAIFRNLQKHYTWQKRMIIGEGVAFLLTLAGALWVIHSSYYRQMKNSEQRRNFLLAITHELKSPIASVQLALETLLKHNLPREKRVGFLTVALDENERLYRLVENLLLAAKLDSAYKPGFEEVEIHAMAASIVQRLRSRHPEATIVEHYDPNLPLISAEVAGLTSVLSNLLENAVNYADDQPKIELHISFGNHLHIEVADNGPGIPVEERSNVFERFYRIGNEETRKTKGTGLGLFIVRQIVKAHGGTISIAGNHPKGTVFHLTLPLTPPAIEK